MSTEGGTESLDGKIDSTFTSAWLHGGALAQPRQIGPYKILETIGEGGMGVVYLAEQTEPIRRRVALKLIKVGLETKEVVARFEAERQALALMDHPHIAKVYEAGSSEMGRPYFVMEYVRGVPLEEYCDRQRLTIRDRLNLFLQVCQAVEHAHGRGIIHRDLKPSNILVSTPDEKPIAKVIDFGVARATNQRLTEKTVYTEIGSFIGTPAYMSPEQAEMTSEEVDQRTDVYSLGVILYEIVTGELPLDPDVFSKAAYDEIIRRIREEEPPLPSMRWSRLNVARRTDLAARRRDNMQSVHRALHGDLDWVAMKAIEKERQRRYRSAAHLADDIRRHLADMPVEAGPPSVGYRCRKFLRRHKGPVTAAAVVGVVLALGLLGTTWFAVAARRNALRVSDSLAQVLRLSDIKKLGDLEVEAASFSPFSGAPEAVRKGVESWFERLDGVKARTGEHRERLAELKNILGGASSGPVNPDEAWQLSVLDGLVQKLEALDDGEGGDASMRAAWRRMDRIRKVLAADDGEAWREAIESIRDTDRCPMYQGLVMEPQFGLMPLGKNSRSGLWEFVDLLTGEAPARGLVAVHRVPEIVNFAPMDPSDEARFAPAQMEVGHEAGLVMTEDTGIVYVLIPGRTTSGPYLISKYEATQGQWMAVMGENPSQFRGGTLPVENVTWSEASEFCRRVAGALPSAAQWEHACKAGSRGPYGLDEHDPQESLRTVLDELAWFRLDKQMVPVATNPVGTKRANGFGLHDMHGNVLEWCEDVHENSSMMLSVEATRPPSSTGERMVRGGFYFSPARECRCDYVTGSHVTERSHHGLRPVRALKR